MADQNRKTSSQEGNISGDSLDSNLFMEGLADLIHTSLSYEQSSSTVKDDQHSSFHGTMSQMCNAQEQNREAVHVESVDVVQQREVSSSKPSPSSLLNHNVVGPLLLQALDGFLFIVSADGIVEFVSDNISHYLNYSVDDLIGKSIYRFLHPASHQFFGSCLESLLSKSPSEIVNNRSFSHEAKFKINTADDFSKELDDSNYLRTRLQFFHQSRRMSRDYDFSPNSPDTATESQSYLVCIAQRIGSSTNERSSSASVLNLDHCQFTTKQDLQGKILNCDSSSLRAYLQSFPGSITIRDFVGKNVLEFCHPYDKDRLRQHHEEVVKNGTNMSGVYRFQILKGRYVFVQTKSKLFKNPTNNKPEFIMSTHSIVRMCDSDAELKGSAEKGLMQAIIGPTLPNHRESSWMNNLSDSTHLPTASRNDSCFFPNSSSSMLPPPDSLDSEPNTLWNRSHPHFSRSFSAVGPTFSSNVSRPSSVTSDQSPQHMLHQHAQGAKRCYKRKRSSPSADVRIKSNCYGIQLPHDDHQPNCRLNKKSGNFPIVIPSSDDMYSNISGAWNHPSPSGGILPPLQALQQLQVTSPNDFSYKSESSVHGLTLSSDHNSVTVSASSDFSKFLPSGRPVSTKREGLRALLTANDDDEPNNDYEMNSMKNGGPSLLTNNPNLHDLPEGNANCFNRSPPQEPQSTTQLGENPNSPSKLKLVKRGQSPGRCNLLMNLLTGATDDEDDDCMKVNESRNRASMRILAKLETLQALPDTSAGLIAQNEKNEVESTSENNTLLKALLKCNSEGDKPTKKAEILSKLLSDSSDDVFIHPSTEITSTVGNDSDGFKLFLTSSGQKQSCEPNNFSQRNSLLSDGISTPGFINAENVVTISGSDCTGLSPVKSSVVCSTVAASTSTFFTTSQQSIASSLVSAASSSLSFLISSSGNVFNDNLSSIDHTSTCFGGDGRKPITNANCKLLKELLSTQPTPQNIVHPCRISALPMATPQTVMMKKSQNLNSNIKAALPTPNLSLETSKEKQGDKASNNHPLFKLSSTDDEVLSKSIPSTSQGNDLGDFLMEDGDLDIESILSSMTTASLDLPLAEDSSFEPLMMSQIEHAIMTADLSAVEIDQLINNSDGREDDISKSAVSHPDKMAINEIQQELMQLDAANRLSKTSSLTKINNSGDKLTESSRNVPNIPMCSQNTVDVSGTRTSLMTVSHKQGSETTMSSTNNCNSSSRRRSLDLPMQPSSEIYGENSLQHFKDMMNVSIAPNVLAPRTSSQMTLGQLLNGSARTSSESKDSNNICPRNKSNSLTGGTLSQVQSIPQGSPVPSSPILPPTAALMSKRGTSLPMGAVPGSLQALHQHHSFTHLSASHSSPNNGQSTSSSVVSFKSTPEHGEVQNFVAPVSSGAILSNVLPNRNLAINNNKELVVQQLNVKVIPSSNQTDTTKAFVAAPSSAVPINDETSSSSLSLSSIKQPVPSTVNAKLALKGVLQGRSQGHTSNQTIASVKLPDVFKLSKKAEEQFKILGQHKQERQVHLRAFTKLDSPADGFLEVGENHPNMPFTFQTTSSDLDDLEVIIAQEEKESINSDNRLQAQMRSSTSSTVTSDGPARVLNTDIQTLGMLTPSNISGMKYKSSNSGFVQLHVPNPTNVVQQHQQFNQHKLGYISIGSVAQHLNQQNQQAQFVGLKNDVIVASFAKKQETPHKIVLVGEQSGQDKLFHVPVGSPIIKHQLVPHQFQPHQQFFLQQQVSQSNTLLPQSISYQSPLQGLPQQLILSQVCPSQFIQQPRQQSQHQLLPVQLNSVRVKNFPTQHVLNQQTQQQQQLQQFGSNIQHFQQIQLQPLQSHPSSQQSLKTQGQQSEVFQQQEQQQQHIPQLILQQNVFQQNTSLHNSKQILINTSNSTLHPRMQQQPEQTGYETLSSINITQPLFGVDGPDIGNLEDDEIYQLISALSNEESAFCLSQLSEEAIHWADNNVAGIAGGAGGETDKSKEGIANIGSVFSKNTTTDFLAPGALAAFSKNVLIKPGKPEEYSRVTTQANGVNFLNKPSENNVVLDSLMFRSDVFVDEVDKFNNTDNTGLDTISHPKRHAMLEKLLAE